MRLAEASLVRGDAAEQRPNRADVVIREREQLLATGVERHRQRQPEIARAQRPAPLKQRVGIEIRPQPRMGYGAQRLGEPGVSALFRPGDQQLKRNLLQLLANFQNLVEKMLCLLYTSDAADERTTV